MQSSLAMLAVLGMLHGVSDHGRHDWIRVVRTWEDLKAQPAIELGGGVRVRLGLEADRIPQWSGAYLYCLAENYVRQGSGVGRPVGPVRVDFVVDGPRLDEAKEVYEWGRQIAERPTGNCLYVRPLTVHVAGRFRLTVTGPKGRTIAQAFVDGTREAFHPWMPWLDGLHDPKTPGEGIALPQVDGFEPIESVESGVIRTGPLPRYLPGDRQPKLTIEVKDNEIVIRSETDFTTSRPDYHFLARWWVNDRPFLPKQLKVCRSSVGYGLVSEDTELQLTFEFRPERLRAKAGDKIGLQLMHAEGEWQWCTEHPWAHGGGSFRRGGENVRVSNRIDFIAPRK
jgi:hypothetical protein